jgi:hypothetical protein
MSVVKIADILTPEVWNQYGENMTTEKSLFWTSGVVANVPGVKLPEGGSTINMPHFNDLSGDLETLDDDTALTPEKITTGKQKAVIIGRGKAWGSNDLAAVFAGADPARSILNKVSSFWQRKMQAELLSTVKGVFASSSMSALISDISAQSTADKNSFNANTFLDAMQLLGDAKSAVTAIAMHSSTETYLAKQQLIAYEKGKDASDRVAYYMGKRVIVDDGLPVTSGVFTTYIFGNGAIGYASATVGKSDLETDRDILAGEDVFAMRKRFILHPVGMQFTGTPVGSFPTPAELATGANWNRVFDHKSIPMIAFKHKLA